MGLNRGFAWADRGISRKGFVMTDKLWAEMWTRNIRDTKEDLNDRPTGSGFQSFPVIVTYSGDLSRMLRHRLAVPSRHSTNLTGPNKAHIPRITIVDCFQCHLYLYQWRHVRETNSFILAHRRLLWAMTLRIIWIMKNVSPFSSRYFTHYFVHLPKHLIKYCWPKHPTHYSLHLPKHLTLFWKGTLRVGRCRHRILGGGAIFRACPGWPWGPLSLLYNGYRVSFRVYSEKGVALTISPPSPI